MKKLLPKNPLAAAGLGALVGAGIAGYKMWSQYKSGDVTRQQAVAGVVKQSIIFGGVAAASTVVGGQGGGGAGLAVMSMVGLGSGGGRGGGGGSALPGLISEALGVGSITGGGQGGRGRGGQGGRGGMGGGQGAGGGRGGQGGGQSSSLIDSIANKFGEILVPESEAKAVETSKVTPDGLEATVSMVEAEIEEDVSVEKEGGEPKASGKSK